MQGSHQLNQKQVAHAELFRLKLRCRRADGLPGLCEKSGVTGTKKRGARGGMIWNRRLEPNPKGRRPQGAELSVWLYLEGSSLKLKYMREDM